MEHNKQRKISNIQKSFKLAFTFISHKNTFFQPKTKNALQIFKTH